MISFIVPYSPDTVERIKNKDTVLKYYKTIIPDAEFIVEEVEPNNTFNKCKAYNSGALKASNKILAFIDIDIIVSKESLFKCIDLAQDTNNIAIGYNGIAIYLTYKAKEMLGDKTTYENISNVLSIQTQNLNSLYKTDLFEVGNLKAVGGCLIMHADCFRHINGFNPNFVGWGYEDNEVVIRSHKLGKEVLYTNTKQPLLYHLPHHDLDIDKSQHFNYNNNRQEYNRVIAMKKEEIKQYIAKWKL